MDGLELKLVLDGEHVLSNGKYKTQQEHDALDLVVALLCLELSKLGVELYEQTKDSLRKRVEHDQDGFW